MTTPFAPKVTQQNSVTVVELGPEYENLDEKMLDSVRTVLLDVVNTAQPPWVVIDLSHTTFFGSSFIEILFRMWNRLSQQPSGRFAISGISDYCREVLEVTHLDQLWPLYENVEVAVAALSEEGEGTAA